MCWCIFNKQLNFIGLIDWWIGWMNWVIDYLFNCLLTGLCRAQGQSPIPEWRLSTLLELTPLPSLFQALTSLEASQDPNLRWIAMPLTLKEQGLLIMPPGKMSSWKINMAHQPIWLISQYGHFPFAKGTFKSQDRFGHDTLISQRS